jgi:regulator of vacuolar morphogenesis
MMQSQDANVDELMKIIIRQRELGTQINEELEVQNELLKLADEEADMFVHPLSSTMFALLITFPA